MGLITINPTANQSPDATLGGLAVQTPTNTGYASTTASVGVGGGTQTKSWRGFSFPAAAGQIISKTLKVDHTSSGALTGSADNAFTIEYSTNGGANWTFGVLRTTFTTSQGPLTLSVSLSVGQDVTAVQVRSLCQAFAGAGETASATGTISNVRVEVVTANPRVVTMF